MWIDLHIHTTFSDGTLTPDEVIATAKKSGLCAIAFTDHDSVDALDNYTDSLGLEIIPGTELSAREEDKSVHVLGYFIDRKNEDLNGFIRTLKKARVSRGERMVEKLNDFGIDITMDEVRENVTGEILGRPHIARVLLNKGVVNNLQEAFSIYIGNDKPCYVPKPNIGVSQVVKVIKKAGGIPVLAHPIYLGNDRLIFKFIDEGIEGLEVWYPAHGESDIERYLKIAREKNLIVTGGSDSHGNLGSYTRIGDFKVDYKVLVKMKLRS
ncbi:hypothetical protein CH333_04550 [candidate division WOR-3 bacterium JGI_Cruoil_03_44_89]|uniref:Polymerase/histidinol phosphatase N-terminal domain-containing protein n=1 Tax=candidate division WOR-3 bacterium JGI_Cruoil_03_44_89 TaxID=1973748 RepID=A0A235BUU5_UNCW3|nr:MAG: hypothetical protein CH333_04550 [candidate division WOR-3 bacterium JGI_Cruoil_03_44_89]